MNKVALGSIGRSKLSNPSTLPFTPSATPGWGAIPGSKQPTSRIAFAFPAPESGASCTWILARPPSHVGGVGTPGPKDSKLRSLLAVQVPTATDPPAAFVRREL